MRLISINEIQGDEILAQPIFDIDGRKLLNQGISLKPSYIQKLHEKGVFSVYVDDSISEGIEMDDALCTQTRMQAKQVISKEIQRFSKMKEVDLEVLNTTIHDIVEEILSKRNDLINLKDVRLQDEYTFAHSVNVCVLSGLLANKLGHNKDKIKSICFGALMHDFGKVMVSQDILNKEKEKLTEEEVAEIKKHPLYGYNILKDDPRVTSTTKISILMHHENVDGTGYPLKLPGEKIHYSARIISICDIYDQMTSDKKHNNALSITDTVEYLTCYSGTMFDKTFTSEFLSMIPIFPNGTIVLLSNGLIGIVIKNNPKNLTRPVVRMLYNPKTKAKYNISYVVDLMDDLSLKILREIQVPAKELKK